MAPQTCDREARAWTHVDADKVVVGDLVSAEAGGLPIYRVLGVENGRLWMREERSGRDHIAPLRPMHWKLAASA
jgi:hypothetical protein